MRLLKLLAQHPRRHSRPFASNTSGLEFETLERRTFLDATLTSALTDLQLAPTTASAAINLDQHFNDPLITGQAAVIATSQGTIPLNLFTQQAPKTVSNFLLYANNGSYDDTVIQRAVPGFLLQGGGFTSDQNHINTTTPVKNEFSLSNTLGTITAALATDPNTQQVDPDSATSDWFINDGNNASLDAQKFTVFGQVVYNGMQIVDQIEALPKGSVSPTFEPNVNAGDPPGGVLPLVNYNAGSPIRTSNYVFTTTAGPVAPIAYTATSDATSVLTAAVNGSSLVVTAGSANGVAHVTVTATDLGGHSVNSVFTVQVGQTQVTVGKGNSKLVRFTDADGTVGQISLSGPGAAAVSFGGLGLTTTPAKGGIITVGGTPISITVAVTGATSATSLAIAGKGGNGDVDLTGITTDGPMRAINARNTALTGNLTATGSISNTILASVTNGVITLGSGAAASVSLGAMNHGSIFSTGAIKSISAGTWSSGGVINGTAVGKISIKGAFVGNVDAGSVQSFSASSVTGGSWSIGGAFASLTAGSVAGLNVAVGSVGKLNVKTTFESSVVRATGNISTVSLGTLSNSQLFAGIGSAFLPTQQSDFVADSNIKSVKIKTLVTSNIAANSITVIDFGNAQPVGNGSPFGIAAHQIKSLKGNIGGKPLKLNNLTTAAQVTAAYTAAGITATDPRVNII